MRGRTGTSPPETIATFLIPPPPRLFPGRTGQFNEVLPFVSLRNGQEGGLVGMKNPWQDSGFQVLRRRGADPEGVRPITPPAASSARRRQEAPQKPRTRH